MCILLSWRAPSLHTGSLDSEAGALKTYWASVTYTEARLLGDENAKEHAPIFTALRERAQNVSNGQQGTWRDELVAQALVHNADDALDDYVRELAQVFSHLLGGKTDSPRYRLYFSSPPSTIIRLGLESQLARVRLWLEMLVSEPEPELKAMAEKLRAVIAQGEAALASRLKAEATRSSHRAREIATLVDDINNARLSLYGILAKKAVDRKLPRNWPDRFFQHSARTVKPEPEPTAPATTTPAQTTAARPTT